MTNKPNTRLTRPMADQYVGSLDDDALDEFRKKGSITLAEEHCKLANYTATGRNAKLMLSALKNATGTGKAHSTGGSARTSVPMADLSPDKNPHPPKEVQLTSLDISNLKWSYEMLRRGDIGSADVLMKRVLLSTGDYDRGRAN